MNDRNSANTIIFDIETIPDTDSARRLYDFDKLTDHEVSLALASLRREQSGGSEFLRLHLQKIIAISVVLYNQDTIKVWSLGDLSSDESDLLRRFFHGLETYRPTLVSWNGGAFDLPVIHYRSLLHGVSSHRYWQTGNEDQAFRYNNYLNRYHERHLDLMDVLAAYHPRANAALDEIATILGFPGKMGMSGDKVWLAFQQGELQSIRHYCETDVLNTLLVYLRFQLIRGKLNQVTYEQDCQRIESLLAQSDEAHLKAFLLAWKKTLDRSNETAVEHNE